MGRRFFGGIFAYDPETATCHLNIQTAGLAPSVWTLHFTVIGEESDYSIRFTVG